MIGNEFMHKGNQHILIKGCVEKEGELTQEQFMENVICHGKFNSLHMCLYKREVLLNHGLRFDETCIQGEDTDFNFKVLSVAVSGFYVGKTMYHYNYSSQTALNRWKKFPDRMMENGHRRYVERIGYVERMRDPEPSENDKTEQYEEILVKRRISLLYQQGIDLYAAKQFTAERGQMLRKWMEEIPLAEKEDKKTKRKYMAVVNEKWRKLYLIAKARDVYYKIFGL